MALMFLVHFRLGPSASCSLFSGRGTGRELMSPSSASQQAEGFSSDSATGRLSISRGRALACPLFLRRYRYPRWAFLLARLVSSA